MVEDACKKDAELLGYWVDGFLGYWVLSNPATQQPKTSCTSPNVRFYPPLMLKIGDLASRSGVSIRTLHHYDEIGLLSPSHRTESGHRVYGREEVVRLQQILSLRQMGFALDQIRDLLDRRGMEPRRVLELHIERLRETVAEQQQLIARLESLAAHCESAGLDEYLQAMEMMTMFEKYYTKEQLEALAKRREAFGEETMREVQEEWPRLIASVREEMQKGTDPKDPRVQALARRWRELIEMFTGGDPGIEQSLRSVYRAEPQFAAQQGLDGGISEYVQKALA
jgi:DNA-binding transcriptional MerR regulator